MSASTQLNKEQCLADDLAGDTSNRARPRVKAAIHPAIARFLEQKELVFSLIDGLGSPLNVIFPELIEEPIGRFERIYKERQLQGRIFYTSKPNKSIALKKHAALTNVGLDVSSEGELKTALSKRLSALACRSDRSKEHRLSNFVCAARHLDQCR